MGVSLAKIESSRRTRFGVDFGHLESHVPPVQLRRHLKPCIDPVHLKFQENNWRNLLFICAGERIDCACGCWTPLCDTGTDREQDLGWKLENCRWLGSCPSHTYSVVVNYFCVSLAAPPELRSFSSSFLLLPWWRSPLFLSDALRLPATFVHDSRASHYAAVIIVLKDKCARFSPTWKPARFPVLLQHLFMCLPSKSHIVLWLRIQESVSSPAGVQ